MEFGGFSLIPADKVKQGQKSLVGAMVVMPHNSTILGTDSGNNSNDNNARAAATVRLKDGTTVVRGFMLVMTKDQNHRYADGFPVEHMNGEGAGIPEDSQQNSNMALNYGIEPLWFRFAIPPNAPFGGAGCNGGVGCYGTGANAHQAYSNVLTAGADPVTPVFTASAGQEVRLHAAVPHTTSRGSTLAIHGHVWQRDPYVCPGESQDGLTGKCNDADGGSFLRGGNPVVGSRAIGENPVGFAQGGQETDRDLLADRIQARRQLQALLRSSADAAAEPLDDPIADALDRLPETLSGGERRLLEVWFAASRHPAVLVADEPLRGLAPLTADAVARRLVAIARRGTAVLVTGHEVHALLAIADHVVWMTGGTTHHLGNREAALAHTQFRRNYLSNA